MRPFPRPNRPGSAHGLRDRARSAVYGREDTNERAARRRAGCADAAKRASFAPPVAGDRASQMIDPLIGQTFGQYELQDRLGRGGMAAVYRAVQPALGRAVAVKVLSLAQLPDPTLP